ncbi:MAG: AMP-dependent synthetase/ligase [bacterium]
MSENIPQILFDRAMNHPDEPALMFKEKGQYVTKSVKWFWDRVERIASGLLFLGINEMDKVAIMSSTRVEWTLTDLAIISLHCVTATIYPSLLENDVKYILDNSDSKYVFVENTSMLKRVLNVKKELSELKKVILFEDSAINNEDVLTLKQLEQLGEAHPDINEIKRRMNNIKMEDTATIIYTSGTTGPPKGAEILHRNIIANLKDVKSLEVNLPGDITLAYLPLAHAYERINQFGAIYANVIYAFAENLDTVAKNIEEVRPTILPGVPRVYEKIYARIMNELDSGSKIKKRLFFWALNTGKASLPYRLKKKRMPFGLNLKYKIAKMLVFNKLSKKLGGRLRIGITAAAPLSPTIIEFFNALGIPIYEGYGMTETFAPAIMSYEGTFKIGYVGKALPSMQVKIANDNEVLLKGPAVFKGYYKKPEGTPAWIDEDGWLHTGDLGEMDDEGFVRITGRKKDLIITAGGKNITPQNIENLFTSDAYISHCVVYGDNKKYLTAVLSLNSQEIIAWAKQNNISFTDYADLMKNKNVYEFIKQKVDKFNEQLASFETIKKFIISDHEFTIESGELTPTMKVKKNKVLERFKDQLDRLYEND